MIPTTPSMRQAIAGWPLRSKPAGLALGPSILHTVHILSQRSKQLAAIIPLRSYKGPLVALQRNAASRQKVAEHGIVILFRGNFERMVYGFGAASSCH